MRITNEDDLIEPSMAIITAAGDGRNLVFAAGDAMAAGAFDRAADLLGEGHSRLRDAHRVHTDCIQEAAVGSVPYSLLFTHAEDTLMTANSELRLMKKMLVVVRAMDRRIAALEASVTPEAVA